MLIDWFTVGAQALNFVILVWLLKRFLYKPILDAIDAREARIAKQLADADAKELAAKQERDEFQRKNNEFDQQRAALFSEATNAAKAARQNLLNEARQTADALSAKRQEALLKDAHNLNQLIRRKTQQEVFAITRKTLMDLAGASLEERMSEVFINHLHTLPAEAKAGLAKALRVATLAATVRSVFELPTAQQSAIQIAINDIFAADIKLKFETVPHLVSGVELTAGGQKVSWSIAEYLLSLENGIDELLGKRSEPEPGSK
ncbi:MAG: F0F1 ATP synthase subunit B [Steroidobacteraceae bacterium]